MFDGPVRPVHAVYAVEPLRAAEIRRRPGRGQLRAWLRFSKACARKADAAPAAEAEPTPRVHHDEGAHTLDIDA